MLLRYFILLLSKTVVSTQTVRLAVAAVGDQERCVAYRIGEWTANPFMLRNEEKYLLTACPDEPELDYGIRRAVLVDSNCNVSSANLGSVVFVKAPFSAALKEKLGSGEFEKVLQVRGELDPGETVVVSGGELGDIYRGSIIMYFLTLIHVSISAVVIEAGREAVQRHASKSPLARASWTQTRTCLIVFIVGFMVILTVAFTGYTLQPLLFQAPFALFLCCVAVTGLYHLLFPAVVAISTGRYHVTNRSYWGLERGLVLFGGILLFGIWFWFRTLLHMWPLQIFLMYCVSLVPLRYAPCNCVQRMGTLTFIACFFSVLQTYIMPAVSGAAPMWVDILTAHARLPSTNSPDELFPADSLEPNLAAFRIPLFGPLHPCSYVIDSTFGLTNFLIPAILIKASLTTDHTIADKTIIVNNFTAGVLAFMCTHSAIFIWSYIRHTPVNSNLCYLPVVTLTVVLNSWRVGRLREVMGPPVGAGVSVVKESKCNVSV